MKKQLAVAGPLLLVFALTLTTSCGFSRVERVDTERTIDLSTRWNDTDSRETAAEMIKEALARPWLNNFQKTHGGKEPVVIVGTVLNKSHDHIPTETFTKDLERELTNSGRVTFVASKSEREEMRSERQDQQTNASKETANRMSQETGANYMLKGVINSFEEEATNSAVLSRTGKEQYKYFEVTLELIDMENNTKVWYGDKKIKKLMTRKKFGF